MSSLRGAWSRGCMVQGGCLVWGVPGPGGYLVQWDARSRGQVCSQRGCLLRRVSAPGGLGVGCFGVYSQGGAWSGGVCSQ